MTTVAYKDGTIAVDSRMSADNLIVSDKYNKIAQIDNHVFVFTGATCDIEDLVEIYFERKEPTSLEVAALVFDGENKKLMIITASKDRGVIKTPLDLDDVFTSGSGGDFALIAMDLGATAAEAVEIASTRDMCTGGPVRTIVILPELVPTPPKARKPRAKRKPATRK